MPKQWLQFQLLLNQAWQRYASWFQYEHNCTKTHLKMSRVGLHLVLSVLF